MHILALLLAAALQIMQPAWKPAPPAMPKGARIAVLEGDIRERGLFTIRLELPKGAVIKPHTHPRPERVTILSGRVTVGFGETTADASHRTTFTSGGFYVNPPNEPHYLLIEKKSVLQLTCEGPWEVNYVE